MDEIGINGQALSHTQSMESMDKQTLQKQTFTKGLKENGENASLVSKESGGLLLSPTDAEEYRVFKRQKRIAEVLSAISHSESVAFSGENVQRICERAARLRQAAVKVTPSGLETASTYLANTPVKVDCVIGGTGETLAKVKAYEAKLAIKMRASELTVVLSPSLVNACKYGEIKRELKKICRAAKKTKIKVWVDKTYPYATIARLARIASEVGASYFCVPHFDGCEKLRFDVMGGCRLEVSDVETVSEFKRLLSLGVGRIVTDKVWEIYSEWMREAEKATVGIPVKECVSNTPTAAVEEKRPQTCDTSQEKGEKKEEKTALNTALEEKNARSAERLLSTTPQKPFNPETDYRCRLEGSDLKFL